MTAKTIELALVFSMLAVTAAAWILPAVVSALESLRGPEKTAFILLALAAAFYAHPSSAEKSGPTNPPPAAAAPAGRISLYVAGPDGRLIPLGAGIRRAP